MKDVLSPTGDELRQKCETERNEIERLHQEIAELQQIRDDLYDDDDDDSSASSDESQDEEELQGVLNQLIKDNQELVVSMYVGGGAGASGGYVLGSWGGEIGTLGIRKSRSSRHELLSNKCYQIKLSCHTSN